MEHLGQLIDVNIFVFPLIFQLFINNCWVVSIVLSAEVGLEIDGTFLFYCFVLIFLFSGSIWAFTRSSYFQSSKRKMGYLGSYAYIRGRHVASCYEYYSNKRENQWIKNHMFWRLRQWVKVICVCQFQTFTTFLWLQVTWSQAYRVSQKKCSLARRAQSSLMNIFLGHLVIQQTLAMQNKEDF